MRISAFALAALLCWAALPSAASAANSKAGCSKRRATPTTIEAVKADYRAWSARCVSLRDIAIGARLYADRMATLEPVYGSDEEMRRSIVLYDRTRHRRSRKVTAVEVTGVVGSCADQHAAVAAMQAESPGDIVMVSGYCHTSIAAYVRPVAVRVLSRAPVLRLVEAEVPAESRGLIEAPVGLAHRAAHLATAREIVPAIATGDEPAFRRLTRPDAHHELERSRGKPMPAWLRREMREAHANLVGSGELRRAFAAIYPLGDRPERVFVSRDGLVAASALNKEPSTFVVCWCKSADCAGRWPVSAFDADNQSLRTYLCASTDDYLLGPPDGTAIQVTASKLGDGLAEPFLPSMLGLAM